MKFNKAILISIAVHAGLLALLLSNFQFAKPKQQSSGANQPIKAHAVSSKSVEQLVEKLKRQKTSQQKKAQQKLDNIKKAEDEARRRRLLEESKAKQAKVKSQQAKAKRIEEEKKAANLKKKRIKDEAERKKKADLEKKRKAESERKKKADAEKKRKAEAERKRKAKAEAERKRKEAQEKARQEALEAEMQAQMDAEAAEISAAHRQQVLSEVDIFNSRIKSKIERNWFKPETLGDCTFRIKISPGGLVIDIVVLGGAPAHCESGRRAILRAEPLPVSKDPDVFEELKTRTFKLENEKHEESL